MNDTPLTEKRCEPCEGKSEPLTLQEANQLLSEIDGWQITDDTKWIVKNYKPKNFSAAVDFINKVKDVAEDENHHPDIHLTGYKKLRIELSTHAIGGLSENDFIVAAKCDALPIE